jgi:hypothetical protein
MNHPIKIAIPGLWQHFELTKYLIYYMENNPDHVYPNVTIGAVYGNFPYCIWDGGRIFNELRQASMEDIVEIKDYLKDHNIPLRLVYTNPELKPIHYTDRFCNYVTKLCEDELNEIVVNNKDFESYLKEHYPKYSFISSTTKCNSLKESLKEVKDYKYVCLDYNQNHSKTLESLSDVEKEKIEFLCNAICPPGCPNRKEHYRLNGIQALNFNQPYQIQCQITGSTISADMLNSKNNISPE